VCQREIEKAAKNDESRERVCLLTKLLGWDVFTEQGKAFLIN